MRRTTSFSAILLGLATVMTLTSVAQTQAAQVQPAEASIETPAQSLRAQYPEMVRHSGKVLVFAADADANAGETAPERFVLYAPLNRLWLLDRADQVTRHAWIEVKQTPFDHLVLHWMQFSDAAVSDIIPAAARMSPFTVTGDTPHPLAAQYDALLSMPLAQSIDPLPVGAYFSAGGHVFDTAGALIAEWDSYGAEIALRLMPAETSTVEIGAAASIGADAAALNPDPTANHLWQWLAVADLAAALNPEQPSEQENQ